MEFRGKIEIIGTNIVLGWKFAADC